MNSELTNVLVVGAHPDDLELSCSAYVLHFVEQGVSIESVVVASGRSSGKLMVGQSEVAVRRVESIRAAEILGIDEPIFLDNYIAQLEYYTVRTQILTIIEGDNLNKFDMVLTHFPVDPHFDHAIIGTILYDILQNTCHVFDLYFFRSPESYSFIPTETFDVTPYVDKKYQALCAHKSQKFPTLPITAVKLTEEFIKCKKRLN
jgi:LmbE family N-acetylglucosaminyl deacetylase